MLRSILAASLLAVSFPAAAEALNYNIVEFSEFGRCRGGSGYNVRTFPSDGGRTGQKCRQC